MKAKLFFLLIIGLVLNISVNAQNSTMLEELKNAGYYYSVGKYYTAQQIYEKYEKTLNPQQRYNYARCILEYDYLSESHVTKAIYQLKTAGYAGNDKALMYLFRLYSEGKYIAPDRSQALSFLSNACDYENEEAMYTYGKMLNDGQVLTRDTIKAYKLIDRAAAKKYYPALLEIGMMHYIGKGVKRDLSRAENYWKQAAAMDGGDGQFNYAFILLETNKDIPVALAELQKASSSDHPRANLLLAKIYANGLYGVPQNQSKSLDYCKLVVKNSSTRETEQGIYDEALEYLRKNGSVEPSTDSKMLRNTFDNIIKNISTIVDRSNGGKPAVNALLEKIAEQYKVLESSLGFREGKVSRLGRTSFSDDSAWLLNPIHVYRTEIVNYAKSDDAQNVFTRWTQILQKMYPEHTIKRLDSRSFLSFDINTDKRIAFEISWDKYNGSNKDAVLLRMSFEKKPKS